MSKAVLIIDDDEIIRMTTEEILQELGYKTFATDSGDHGLELFSEKHGEIDLIILDLTMPGKSVVDIFSDMKKIDPDIRVLVSSGNNFDPKIEQLRVLGSRGFLQKPYTITDLEKQINAHIK